MVLVSNRVLAYSHPLDCVLLWLSGAVSSAYTGLHLFM